MAVLAGTVVLRDAPGSPSTFLASLDTCNASFTDTNTNETSYFIDNNSMDSMLQCGEPPLNITALFPACSNVTDSCYPPSCLYEDSDRSNLLALCNPDFLGLIPEYNATRRCNFGALNSFQVSLVHHCNENKFSSPLNSVRISCSEMPENMAVFLATLPMQL